MSVSRTVSEIFSVREWRVCQVSLLSYLAFKNIVTLKSGLEVTEGHLNWYHSKD